MVRTTFFILRQLPVLHPDTMNQVFSFLSEKQLCSSWLLPRVLELLYTSWGSEGDGCGVGWSNPPFRWDEERRFRSAPNWMLHSSSCTWAMSRVASARHHRTARCLPSPRRRQPHDGHFPIAQRQEEIDGLYRSKETILASTMKWLPPFDWRTWQSPPGFAAGGEVLSPEHERMNRYEHGTWNDMK